MTMTGKEVVKLLQKSGWSIDRIHGGHYIMVSESQTIAVPVHGNNPLKPGTLNAILKQAGLK